jgi:hypothetical protein
VSAGLDSCGWLLDGTFFDRSLEMRWWSGWAKSHVGCKWSFKSYPLNRIEVLLLTMLALKSWRVTLQA